MRKIQEAMEKGIEEFTVEKFSHYNGATEGFTFRKDKADLWLKSHQKTLITAVLEDMLEEVLGRRLTERDGKATFKYLGEEFYIHSFEEKMSYNQALKHQAQIIRDKIKEL